MLFNHLIAELRTTRNGTEYWHKLEGAWGVKADADRYRDELRTRFPARRFITATYVIR